jgi:hypothetical protein
MSPARLSTCCELSDCLILYAFHPSGQVQALLGCGQAPHAYPISSNSPFLRGLYEERKPVQGYFSAQNKSDRTRQ